MRSMDIINLCRRLKWERSSPPLDEIGEDMSVYPRGGALTGNFGYGKCYPDSLGPSDRR